MTSNTRLFVVTALMLLTSAFLLRTMRAESVPTREPLALCPIVIGPWQGAITQPFDEQTLKVLGVDEYINRLYAMPDGGLVSLYVGYYGSQRQGDTMHSPLNCLPGAGWTPVSFTRIPISVARNDQAAAPEERITVNRYLIEKGLDRQVVVYWYQGHGRVVASEYAAKVHMVLDAIRTNRTDGALVRIVAPVTTTEAEAEQRAVDFARVLYPLLGRHLPS
jgi:EpsI family protein